MARSVGSVTKGLRRRRLTRLNRMRTRTTCVASAATSQPRTVSLVISSTAYLYNGLTKHEENCNHVFCIKVICFISSSRHRLILSSSVHKRMARSQRKGPRHSSVWQYTKMPVLPHRVLLCDAVQRLLHLRRPSEGGGHRQVQIKHESRSLQVSSFH